MFAEVHESGYSSVANVAADARIQHPGFRCAQSGLLGCSPALMLRSRAAQISSSAAPRLVALRGVSKHEGTPSSPFETHARTFGAWATAAARALLRMRTDERMPSSRRVAEPSMPVGDRRERRPCAGGRTSNELIRTAPLAITTNDSDVRWPTGICATERLG